MNASRFRGFPLFWAGRTASQFGDQITILALPWLLIDATSSPLAVGGLEALIFLPVLVLGLPIGAFADQRSRRRSMIEADVLRLLLLASLPVAISMFGIDARVEQVLIVAFLVGVGHALFEAAAQPFLVDLVPSNDIVRANARLSLTEGMAEVAGPALSGVLIAALGASGAIAIDAATFGLSALAMATVLPVRERFADGGARMRAAIREGLRAVTRQPRLRALVCTVGFANLGAGMGVALTVLFLRETIHLEGWEAGLVYAANGAGGIAASFVSQWLVRRLGVSRTVLAGLVGGAIGFSLIATTSRGSWFITATLGMAMVGVGVVTSFIASASLRQRMVAPELLGRVTTSYRTVVNGAVAVGALTGGLIGEFTGVRQALLLGAGVYVAAAVSGFLTPLNSDDPAEPASSS